MRAIDRFAGVPLCHLAGWWERLRSFFARRTHRRNPRVILVSKFFGIGSILLTTPLLRTLKENFPDAKLVFLTFEDNRELVRRFPDVDVVRTIRTTSPRNFLFDTLEALIALRRLKVDLAFDLEFFSKFSTLLTYLTGSPVRVGFSLPARWRQRLVTDSVPIDRSKHVTEVFLSQSGMLGISSPDTRPSIMDVTAAEIEASRKHIGSDRLHLQLVCLNVNAGETSLDRRWEKTKFAALARRLADEYPEMQFYFTGTQRERAYVEEVLQLIPGRSSRFQDVAGRLNLGEFLGLLIQSRLLITSDSGPLHLASTIGVPTVSFFGPEAPDFYGPLDDKHDVFYERILCSPCLNVYQAKEFRCPYNQRCLERIQVHQVFEAARRVLSRKSVERSVA